MKKEWKYAQERPLWNEEKWYLLAYFEDLEDLWHEIRRKISDNANQEAHASVEMGVAECKFQNRSLPENI